MPRAPNLSRPAAAVRASVFAELQPHIDAFRARGGELIPLQIGDTCWSPPEAARFSVVCAGDATDAALYRYGPLAGCPSLLARIGAQLAARGFPLGRQPNDNILVGCGATHALFCTARAILDAGDDVLVAAPYWPLVPGLVASCDANTIEVPLTRELYADPGADAARPFQRALTPRSTAIYLITPNNPDGKVLSLAQLEAIAAFAERHDLWVIADEVYVDFTFGLPHVSIASIGDMARRTLTAYSLSKSHALAGARIGYVVAPANVVSAARRIANHTVYNTPLVAQRAATAALAHGTAYLEGVRAGCRTARDVAVDALRGSGADFAIPEGGAYLFLDFERVLEGRPLRDLLERAIDRGVLLAPGDAFGAASHRCARLCYTGVDLVALRDGIGRLRAAIDSLTRR